MTGDFDRRALDLYARSLELPEEERESFLRESAGEDQELWALLAEMLGVGKDPERRFESLYRRTTGRYSGPVEGLIGERLGDFLLLEDLGRGGMGRVYLSEQLSLRRSVALKVLDPVLAREPELLRRFQHEPETQGRLQHPHIVRVIASATQEGWHYFAMEYVAGANLARILEAHRAGELGEDGPARLLDVSDPRVCAIVIEKLARALHYAHGEGILHRDVKPHNILIDARGEPYLTDFGLAKDFDQSSLSQALPGGLMGTLAYMSPEQARSFQRVDQRADVYSLGAVLYEMLTLRPPLEADSPAKLLHKVLNSHPLPPHYRLPRFHKGLSGLCSRALAKQPAERFESAQEMADELRLFLDGRPMNSRPVRRWEQIGERRIDRRAVIRAGLGATLVASVAVIVTSSVLPGRDRARLLVELPDPSARAEVSLRPIGPDSALGPRRPLGEVRGREVFTGLAPGAYRVLVAQADGAFAELHRVLLQDEEVLAAAHPQRPNASDGSMVQVAGGEVLIEGPFLNRSHDSAQRCESFWIDRGTVTNGEYQEFLRQTGRAEPSPWAQLDWARIGRAQRADWDDLPAVLLTWSEARDYAEWRGKRLPTAAEWRLAQGLVPVPWLTEADRVGIERRFVVARPQMEPWIVGGDPKVAAAYLRYVRPSRLGEQEAYGPNRL